MTRQVINVFITAPIQPASPVRVQQLQFVTMTTSGKAHHWQWKSYNITRQHTCQSTNKTEWTRMWANAQRDGRPAEYRWRPLFNAAKFGWRPLLECHAVMLPRCETRWNLQGCPKLPNRSQPLVGGSSPYSGDMWMRYCCLTIFFFRLSIHALVAKIQTN